MVLPIVLQRELRRALRTLRAANGITAVPGGSGKALEAWLLMKLAQTASALPNWNVTLRQGDGTPLPPGNPFLFSASQSGIRPPNPNEPGFVLLSNINHADQSLELHGGLKWQGRSGATHECDVSVVPAMIALALRSNGGGMPEGLPIAAFECKDKTTAGTADEMRQTLARLYDLALVTQPIVGPCRIWERRTNRFWGRRSSKYVSFFTMGSFGIVRAGHFHLGARHLGHHYSIGRFGNVYGPSSMTTNNITTAFSAMLNNLPDYM